MGTSYLLLTYPPYSHTQGIINGNLSTDNHWLHCLSVH